MFESLIKMTLLAILVALLAGILGGFPQGKMWDSQASWEFISNVYSRIVNGADTVNGRKPTSNKPIQGIIQDNINAIKGTVK